MNSREAISAKKCVPPFLTQVSVSWVGVSATPWRPRAPTYLEGAELCVGVLASDASLERSHGLLRGHGFGPDDVGDLEVEGDVFPVSRQRSAMRQERGATYKLLLVALSICSSRAELAEDDHQLIILTEDDDHSSGRSAKQTTEASCRECPGEGRIGRCWGGVEDGEVDFGPAQMQLRLWSETEMAGRWLVVDEVSRWRAASLASDEACTRTSLVTRPIGLVWVLARRCGSQQKWRHLRG